ncbi:homeobox protein cut-like 1 isoform X2 [Solenopsis invicta]|uniref:homeobox protein cut-like 1 isoform X2 n=1 Tax=Solenopsis invicta TaxID=13686 RepID=UPI0005961288|nr:homeobox protein cut-like 1 isoform X2 [Solenopsis invicta]XP_025985948.1 homeobox protein cut-like 1 isoform X2 [Solenopsis invicta]XP_025985949.1 homeobox protein cut-like 1 isoform X2 [Solenopsis invicta]XP_039301683.1 homeobox protein cut-like 1 isoform X2 [Solenopsis invicta]
MECKATVTIEIEKCGAHDSPLLREIIELIELFKKFVISRTKRTPEVECAYAINLHDCRIKIADTLAELEALQETSDEQNSSSEIFLRDIVTCINDEEEIMRSIKKTSEIEIPREIEESTREMLIVKEREKMRKKILWSEIDLAKHKLHDVIKINAATEKKLFDLCAKVEQEYVVVLAKYDCDVGMLHALTEELSKDNEVIKAEIKEMEDQLTLQRELYIQFKKKREIALIKAFNEKLEFFKHNRATRVIQKAWRAYFERISLKKRRKTKRK